MATAKTFKRVRQRDMKVECPAGSGYYQQIPSPPLSTVCFKCPACGTDIDTWCYPDHDARDENLNCDERAEMFIEVFNRWVDAIQKHRIPCWVSYEERTEQIQKIIQEVETENADAENPTDNQTARND